jgi:hypothetical protein
MSTRREARKGGTPKPPSRKQSSVPHQREALLGIVVGRKGVGKTHKTLQEIEKYSIKKEHPRRALLFDVNGEFPQFPTIALKDIKAWCAHGKIEIRRISIFKAKGDADLTVNGQSIYKNPTGKMTLNEMAGALYFILQNYFVGLLLVEDINKYLSDSLPSDVIGAICTQRHVGVDVIIHFQNIGRFGHPKIIGNASFLRMHKVTDTVERHSKKFEELVEPLSICEQMVNRRYKWANETFVKDSLEHKKAKSFHVYYDMNDEKIKGAFSEKEFIQGVEAYLRKNARTLINPLLQEEDLYTGKKLYPDRTSLIKTLINQKKEDYYGN